MLSLFEIIKNSKNYIINTVENVNVNGLSVSGTFCFYSLSNEFIAEYSLVLNGKKVEGLIDSNCENFDDLKELTIKEISERIK